MTRNLHRVSALMALGIMSVPFIAFEPANGQSNRQLEFCRPLCDDYSFLEEEGNQTRAWVEQNNARTVGMLKSMSDYDKVLLDLRATGVAANLNNDGGSVYNRGAWSLDHGWVYQLQETKASPRGVWRRTKLDSFKSARPVWEDLLDMGKLAKADGVNWEFYGGPFSPDGSRRMVMLGASTRAAEWREFDLRTKKFIPNGFKIPLADFSQVDWLTNDTLIARAGFKIGIWEGKESPGYPVKLWRRGQKFVDAKTILEISAGGSSNFADIKDGSPNTPDHQKFSIAIGYRESGESKKGGILLVSADGTVTRGSEKLRADIFGGMGAYGGWLYTYLSEDWAPGRDVWKKGSIVAIKAQALDGDELQVQPIFIPTGDASATWIKQTRDGLFLFGTQLGVGRAWRALVKGDNWSTEVIPNPSIGNISPLALDKGASEALLLYSGFLTPPTLYQAEATSNKLNPLKSVPDQFDPKPYFSEQRFAASKDGQLVPYFIVANRELRLNGRNPVLMHGYGGFNTALTPEYLPAMGRQWLAKGGIYVVAGVRGGNERGYKWAVKRAEREWTYLDTEAVAEDLIRRRMTSPKLIGLQGHSAGGLWAGVMINRRPDLFGAAIMEGPVLDLFRLDLTAAGILADYYRSELGDALISAERAFLGRTSPFQNLWRNTQMPEPLVLSSSNDTTVFPSQPRRYVAKMKDLGLGHLYYEAREGGHSLGTSAEDVAVADALKFSYLHLKLMRGDESGRALTGVEVSDPR